MLIKLCYFFSFKNNIKIFYFIPIYFRNCLSKIQFSFKF